VKAIFVQFNEWYEQWAKRTAEEGVAVYDPLDPEADGWKEDFPAFTKLVCDMDLRLGGIAKLAFKGMLSLEGLFKLIHGFQGLLTSRSVLFKETESQYPQMITMFSAELDTVKEFYDNQLSQPSLAKNMPRVAGTLSTLDNIRGRVTGWYKSFIDLDEAIPVFASAEALRVYQKYTEMLEMMAAKDKLVFAEWAATVGDDSDANLNLPLLLRDDTSRLLQINFDPQLVSVLREVKYLERSLENAGEAGQMPDEAAAIFARNETFRQFLGRWNPLLPRAPCPLLPAVSAQHCRFAATQLLFFFSFFLRFGAGGWHLCQVCARHTYAHFPMVGALATKRVRF
jgi:dynein heavy chain